MSVVEPPSLPPGDELDGLLRAFFQSQLPHPWPMPSVSLSQAPLARRPPADGRSLIRSRWALAASLGLLLLGSLLLPSRFTQEGKPENGPSGPIIGSAPLRRMQMEHKKQKEVENKNRPGLGADEAQPPEFEESDVPFLK
jgi:hypothetical protein